MKHCSLILVAVAAALAPAPAQARSGFQQWVSNGWYEIENNVLVGYKTTTITR